MKIVSKGRVLNSREFYERKIKRRKFFLVLLSIGAILFVSILIYLARLERFLIKDVTVLGEDVVDKEEIRQITRETITGNYLWLIPRSNAMFYPGTAIERNLIKRFPRLKSVYLNVEKVQTLAVAVDERKPSALYCTLQCFFLDEEGLIFAEAPSFFGGTVYFTYTTKSPIENPLGKKILNTDEFESLTKFIKNLIALAVVSSAIEIGEKEYSLVLSNGGKIIWRSDASLALIRSNLEAFLSNESIKSQKDFLDRIELLDLRIENKVFYRFK